MDVNKKVDIQPKQNQKVTFKDFLYANMTPLQIAVRNNDSKMCQLLLDRGADPREHGEDDFIPLMSAIRVKNE